MRRASVIGGACAAVVLSGCGAGADDPPPPLERVSLRVTAPADGAIVRGGTVDVRGDVSPSSAQVSVLGRPALVTGGHFTVVVPLRPGVNIVDVAAGARARRPAFAALRITRDERVTVPDLGGAVEADVAPRLQALGLEADVTRGGGILDVLRSGARVVCEQRPPSGTRVRRASTVRVLVAKRC
ncbi:MAG: hypothetical protein QOE31_1669 [Solirubrobacteraceae bacterium]|nr:hypothetical protein [Solirubrobacteraceae bacterium]